MEMQMAREVRIVSRIGFHGICIYILGGFLALGRARPTTPRVTQWSCKL